MASRAHTSELQPVTQAVAQHGAVWGPVSGLHTVGHHREGVRAAAHVQGAVLAQQQELIRPAAAVTLAPLEQLDALLYPGTVERRDGALEGQV